MYRSRKATLAYSPDKRNLKEGRSPCPFCTFPKEQILKNYKYFVIVENKFKYHYWEFMDVNEHFMIVPKRHVQGIGEYNKAERQEVIDIMAEWEARGFNVYAREKDNVMKSVPHQHIHLISTKNKKANMAFYLRKPYTLFKK